MVVAATTLLHEGIVLPGKNEPSAAATQSAAKALLDNAINETTAAAFPIPLVNSDVATQVCVTRLHLDL